MLVAAAVVAACSSFGSDSDDDPTVPDGGQVEDGRAADGGGGSDAQPLDAGPPFCTTKPGAPFCVDFEDGKPVAAAFPTVQRDVSVVRTLAFGGAASMRAYGKPSAYAVAITDLGKPLTGGRLTFSYRLRISGNTDAGAFETSASRISLQSGADVCTLEIVVSQAGAKLVQRDITTTPRSDLIAGVYGPDQWFLIALHLSTSTGDAGDGYVHARVTVDGKEGLSPIDFRTECPNRHLEAIPHVEMGVFGTFGEFELHFDDIAIEAK